MRKGYKNLYVAFCPRCEMPSIWQDVRGLTNISQCECPIGVGEYKQVDYGVLVVWKEVEV